MQGDVSLGTPVGGSMVYLMDTSIVLDENSLLVRAGYGVVSYFDAADIQRDPLDHVYVGRHGTCFYDAGTPGYCG